MCEHAGNMCAHQKVLRDLMAKIPVTKDNGVAFYVQ